MLHQWDYLLSGVTQVCDIQQLFMHANRPYWEYYLEKNDYYEIPELDIHAIDDLTLRRVLLNKRENACLIPEFSSENKERLFLALNHAMPLVVVTTHDRKAALRKHYSAFNITFVCIDRRVAATEIEPAWYHYKRQLNLIKPKQVFLSLGWEKLVYASRIRDAYSIPVMDLGEPRIKLMSFNEFLFKLNNYTRTKLRLIKTYLMNKD